jgi:hypothetical protein
MGGLPTGLAYNVAADDLSLFDNSKNDKGNRGGLSPARPSAVPDTNTHGTANRWIFGGLKAIDFSSKGNGANDNVATYSASVARNFGQGLVGVPAVIPMSGTFDFQGSAYGQGALRTTRPGLATAGQDVAVVSSDEPSLRHKPSYAGRSVLFTFGFEGINDNTGYATRDQVLRRIFQWFDDRPTALVSGRSYRAGRQIRLKGGLNAGDRAEQYTWQIGSRTLPTTGRPTSYRFARPGKYRVRVQITDWLGHTAVSPWTVITAR